MYTNIVYHIHKHMSRRPHLRKKVAIRTVLCIQATGFFYDNISYAWSYPVKEVAKPSCKQDHWSKLSADCKMALPVIARANYAAYKDNQTTRLIYSVLWWAPYSDGWDMSKGTHEWVDIVSSEGTPIYAVEDGEVVRARATYGYGNLVTIKHTLADKSVVYSIYGHLEGYSVKEGDTVKEGVQIGTMGHEWMAWGNHLHFAINKTKDNTYAFQGCLDYPKTNDYDIVEKGLCRESLFARTVDPIAFIEYNGIIPAPTLTAAPTSKVVTRSLIKNTKPKIVALAPTVVETQKTVVTTPKQPTTVKTVTPVKVAPTITQVGTSLSSNNITSSEDFLKKYTISIVSNFWNNLKKGWSSSIGIVIKDKNGKEFAGVLDKEISITPSKQNVMLSPRVIRYVSEGKVVSLIEAKDSGSSDLIVSYWDSIIGKISVKVD